LFRIHRGRPHGAPDRVSQQPELYQHVCQHRHDGIHPILFSARNLSVHNGVLTDWIDASGTRAYRLTPQVPHKAALPWTDGPDVTPNPKNILFNPSFEHAGGGVGGGIPDGFWSVVQNDTGAAAFSDSRDSVHGLHSLRIHAYRLTTKNVSSHGVDDRMRKIAHPNPANLLLNPSFEESANWDFPDGFSVLVGKDREAAIFLDSRDSVHGMHSLA
jgi:hypothetical protein